MSNRHERMYPLSGETVEVGGLYRNDFGREAELEKGEVFPADLVSGTTSWKLVMMREERNTDNFIHDDRDSY